MPDVICRIHYDSKIRHSFEDFKQDTANAEHESQHLSTSPRGISHTSNNRLAVCMHNY